MRDQKAMRDFLLNNLIKKAQPYYAVTKLNYYLQGSDIVVCNNDKPLQKFMNGKNAGNKVNIWSFELTTYNITFEWILDPTTRQLTVSHDW